MEVDEFRAELIRVVSEGLPFAVAHQALSRFAAEGGTSEQANAVVLALLDNTDDEGERDFLANIGDCVVGWCSPRYRIWPSG